MRNLKVSSGRYIPHLGITLTKKQKVVLLEASKHMLRLSKQIHLTGEGTQIGHSKNYSLKQRDL